MREGRVKGLASQLPGPGPLGRGTRSEGLVSEFSVCPALPEVLSGKPSLCLLSLSPGDIGGQMGLFIGASILTILELFDYIYEVRFGIARGGMTWRPHPALTSRTKSWMGGEHGLSSPRAASPSLSMDIVYHHLLGTGGGMDVRETEATGLSSGQSTLTGREQKG